MTNTRYGYFDALRGITMILVVISHVFLFSIDYCPTINLFFCTFRMPLFFFVSGYFAFKSIHMWDSERMKDVLSRKIKVQIVGASICCLVFSILTTGKYPDIKAIIYASNEYWFTFILFRLFFIYMFIVAIAKLSFRRTAKRRQSEHLFWTIIILLTVFCIVFHLIYPAKQNTFPPFFDHIIEFIIPRTFYYFPYFVLGMVARTQTSNFEKILSNDLLKVSLIVFITAIWCAINLRYIPLFQTGVSFGADTIWAYPLGMTTLLVVVQFFYSNRIRLEKETIFNRSLKFIGRRTLDIYFFHFFFLPKLTFLKPFFETYNSVFTQLVIGLSIALIIVGLSLLTGQIIRMSPLLSEWILGVRRNAAKL